MKKERSPIPRPHVKVPQIRPDGPLPKPPELSNKERYDALWEKSKTTVKLKPGQYLDYSPPRDWKPGELTAGVEAERRKRLGLPAEAAAKGGPPTTEMPRTEKETSRWLFLRAVEWINWPSFISQPIVPVLLIFYPWLYLLAVILVLDVVWAAIRYRYVSLSIVSYGASFVSFCKWPAAIGSAIYLFMHHNYVAGIVSLAWPLGLSGIIAVPGQVGRVERLFAQELDRLAKDSAIQEILDESRKQTDRQLKPLREIASAILTASGNCRDSLRDSIGADSEKGTKSQEILIFYEFLYFFMHLTMRVAFGVLSESEIKRLQEYLAPCIASVAVSSYFDHWPDDRKKGLTSDFYANLNRAEIEYSEYSKYALAANEERTDQIAQGIFMSLGIQVAAMAGHENDAANTAFVMKKALSEFSAMNLRQLVKDFKNDSRDLPSPPLDT